MKTDDSKVRIYVLLAATIFIQSFSFLSLKISTLVDTELSLVLLIAALVLMGVRAVVWQKLLKVADLSYVYPYTSLVQVLIYGYAIILFGEQVSTSNIVGLVLMIAGVFLLSRKEVRN